MVTMTMISSLQPNLWLRMLVWIQYLVTAFPRVRTRSTDAVLQRPFQALSETIRLNQDVMFLGIIIALFASIQMPRLASSLEVATAMTVLTVGINVLIGIITLISKQSATTNQYQASTLREEEFRENLSFCRLEAFLR